MIALLLALTLAQQGLGYDNGGVSRGNHLRIPDYRTPGTGAQSYFVATTGNDAFNCQISTTPCLTIQGALNKIPKQLRDGVTVNVAAGSYACFLVTGFYADTGIQQATGGLLIDGALVNSTLATGSATGTATAGTAGSLSTFGTLTDGAATWTVNDLRGRIITTATPTNTGFIIVSNTATSLTIAGSWSAPTGATTYAIQDPSVIINTACNRPATGVSATSASAAGIQFFGNTLTWLSGAITLRNIRVAPAAGDGVRISDISNIGFQQAQIRPAAAGATGILENVQQAGIGGVLALARVHVQSGGINSDVTLAAGSLAASNSLFTNSTSAPAIQIGNQGRAQISTFTSNQITGSHDGIYIGNGSGTPTLGFSSLNITCADGTGNAIWLGANQASNGVLVGSFGGVGPIQSTNVATCGTGVRVEGYSQADIASLTGAAGTTGIAVNQGGIVTFAKAGVTITAGTNEVNLDVGMATAAFTDIAANTCLQSAQYNSKVCGR